MVSNVGSAAISAVSLVDSINNLVIQVFSAMAAGAAIVCSRFIGAKDRNGCNRAARQVVLTVFIISIGDYGVRADIPCTATAGGFRRD